MSNSSAHNDTSTEDPKEECSGNNKPNLYLVAKTVVFASNFRCLNYLLTRTRKSDIIIIISGVVRVPEKGAPSPIKANLV